MIKIRVGESGVKTYISASTGFFGTGGVRSTHSDSSGNAYIDFDDYGPEFSGEIYVDGECIYKGKISSNGTYD
ncbi:MAG: hypothetical protein V7K98_22755 [Nostoc sp.]|uniref:hypothetical protein n=1 Tax=Nostoc sp. TaxID=1180 RepID=UPI002FF83825